jgi:hypothetical protein
MTEIRAPGKVTTETPTLVPVRGCRRVTDAVPVRGVGEGEAVGEGVGDAVDEAWVAGAAGAVRGADEQPAAASAAATATATPMAAAGRWACPQVRLLSVINNDRSVT